MSSTKEAQLDWTELEYDTTSTMAELVFGNTLVADIGPDEFFWIYPCGRPENVAQVWTLDYCTHEIGRYATIPEAKQGAEDYFARLQA